MKKIYKKIISLILTVSLLICSHLPVFAAGSGEEYISELRIIYAENYDEAKSILADSEFKGYKLLRANLNENSKEIGVWLAYKTTTDIEDAITDIAVMQMNGGYTEGNYQEMIQKSYEQYIATGEVYLKAIEYWREAYDAEHYVATSVFRQLNFYNIVSEDVPEDKIPTFEGERLGDIFYEGISKTELATIFMQGNTHVLENIRSLLAMGVSYNEDGKHYLEKVGEAAALMMEDDAIFEEYDNFEDFDGLAVLIAGSILTFSNMFDELEAYEEELDYEDEELTDLEIKYAEYKSFADRMRDVEYLDGMSLYDFCREYEFDEDDLYALYPLVAALNEGQLAMTQVNHYYDVVRYSMTEYPEEALDEMITEQEQVYAETPFNVYSGVDRSIFYGSFALTNEAYRADAYTADGFLAYMFADQTALGVTSTLSAIGSVTLGIWAVRRTLAAKAANQSAEEAARQFALHKQQAIIAAQQMKNSASRLAGDVLTTTKSSALGNAATQYGSTYNDVLNALAQKYLVDPSAALNSGFDLKLSIVSMKSSSMSPTDMAIMQQMNKEFFAQKSVQHKLANTQLKEAQEMTQTVTNTASGSGLTIALYIVSGILLLYSAFSLGMTVYSYYHPEYEDVPVALVDVKTTVDGDRYVKYDVVCEAETNEYGVYEAGDLNAYSALRWNALYYTKSYEAGKPLLADSFTVNKSSSKPKDGYTPVHLFGEVVCYNLNKYNFKGNTNIYLSVKQSKNDKSAVADVPEVVGSMIGAGFLFLAGGLGAAVGVGGTIATQTILKKRKKDGNAEASVKAEPENNV